MVICTGENDRHTKPTIYYDVNSHLTDVREHEAGKNTK